MRITKSMKRLVLGVVLSGTVGDQTVTVTFSEANVDAIGDDAYWDLQGTPSGGLPERLVEGKIIWIPGVTGG